MLPNERVDMTDEEKLQYAFDQCNEAIGAAAEKCAPHCSLDEFLASLMGATDVQVSLTRPEPYERLWSYALTLEGGKDFRERIGNVTSLFQWMLIQKVGGEAAAELLMTMAVLCAAHADVPFSGVKSMLDRTIVRIAGVRKAQQERN